MTTAAMFFMAASWVFVLGLMLACFKRILGHQKHHDPDGIGPAQPPEPGLTERR